jgi:hypothetical protein
MAAASGDRPKNPLFDEALRKHLESLRIEDREAFEHCSARDVIAAVQQLNSSHAAQSRTRRFLVRFAAVIKPLESYFDLVSNVVGSIPGAQLGAIVFGALRFVVKVWSCYALPPYTHYPLKRLGCQWTIRPLRANCGSLGGDIPVTPLLPRLCR